MSTVSSQPTASRAPDDCAAVVLISATSEWRAVRASYPASTPHPSPFGEWFAVSLAVAGRAMPIVFAQGGWGKIAAAASTQYAIDRWAPPLVINLGTCGGFRELIERGTIVLAERTVVYDIIERMGDLEAAIAPMQPTSISPGWEMTSPPGAARPARLGRRRSRPGGDHRSAHPLRCRGGRLGVGRNRPHRGAQQRPLPHPARRERSGERRRRRSLRRHPHAFDASAGAVSDLQMLPEWLVRGSGK
ncbi:MAG: hypothetical protein U0841_13735 [Chloroflexia bacterium]